MELIPSFFVLQLTFQIKTVCVGKTCDSKDYGRYYGMSIKHHAPNKFLILSALGSMNFVISFSLLLTMPIGGQMLESLGSTALSGLYLGVVLMGGLLVLAARSVILGKWFDCTSKI